MLITISTTHSPATDIGYLLHKHPDKVQTFKVSGGQAHIFYPISTTEKCTVALLLELDTIKMVRQMHVPKGSISLHHYVNDRPYVASSFASSAITTVFSSALNGNCKNRPELVNVKMPFEVQVEVLKVKGSRQLIHNIFEPLGYEIAYTRHDLDEQFPDWGPSPFYSLTLKNKCTLQTLLRHLYVLMPVFDNEKHYYVGQADVEKLVSKATEWLPYHPMKDFIIRRYLKHKSSLTTEALSRLMTEAEKDQEEEKGFTAQDEKKVKLHQVRLNIALEVIKKSGSKSVMDLGCGEGKLIRMLLKENQFERILGMDVSYRELLIAKKRLKIEQMSEAQRQRIKLIQGSLLYQDERLEDYDAAAIVEVIEHLDEERLVTFEKVLFACAQPKLAVITTPNGEYNAKYEMEEGAMRHSDHRFEWTRAEFKNWVNRVCETFKYEAKISMVGDIDETLGAPSQMVVFKKK